MGLKGEGGRGKGKGWVFMVDVTGGSIGWATWWMGFCGGCYYGVGRFYRVDTKPGNVFNKGRGKYER